MSIRRQACIAGACRTGALEPWEGKPDTVEKGIVAFSQPDKAKGLTGMADLDRGEFVLVAVGRAILQDPEWVVKVKANRFEDLRDYDAAALQTYY